MSVPRLTSSPRGACPGKAPARVITPEHSARVLLAYLGGDDTGAIWDVSAAPVGA